jgi:hypothetical protein
MWAHGTCTGICVSRTGECCICGQIGKLTFEHVPPEAAFNDRRVFQAKIDALISNDWRPGTVPARGTYHQRGAGRYSLCGKCNSDTGSWYGPAYVEFAYQAMLLLHRSNGTLSLAYPYRIFPLRVLKQIAVMFFSACGPGLKKAHPQLVKFVLDKECRIVPDGIHFWAYLHDPQLSTATRQSGVTGRMILGKGHHVFSEIAFPPFGLVMTFDQNPIQNGLCDVTHFGLSTYRTWDIVYLQLPVLPVVSFLPGDFRTVDQIAETIGENDRLGNYYLNTPIGRTAA